MNILYQFGISLLISIVFITILLYLIYYYKSKISDETDKHVLIIPESINGNLKTYKYSNKSLIPSKNTSSYTFSVWLLFNPLENNPVYKCIFYRGQTYAPQPGVWIDKYNKNLNLIFDTYPSSDTKRLTPSSTHFAPGRNSVNIPNIPLGAWFNLAFTVNTNIVNVYINGEQQASHILPGPVIINNNSHLFIGGSGGDAEEIINGFNGKLTQLRYYPDVLHYRDILNIYNLGITPAYDPVTKSINIFGEFKKELKGGAELIGNKIKYVEKTFEETIGKEIVTLLKNSGIYSKLAKVGADMEQVVGGGLAGIGDFLGDEGKSLIYGDSWKEKVDYMLNDPKLMNDACNIDNYNPYKTDNMNEYNSFDTICVQQYDLGTEPCTDVNTCNNVAISKCNNDSNCGGYVIENDREHVTDVIDSENITSYHHNINYFSNKIAQNSGCYPSHNKITHNNTPIFHIF